MNPRLRSHAFADDDSKGVEIRRGVMEKSEGEKVRRSESLTFLPSDLLTFLPSYFPSSTTTVSQLLLADETL